MPAPTLARLTDGSSATPTLSERTLHQIFSFAIENEREARALYAHAAKLAGAGTDLHRMFKAFEAEEGTHEQRLVEEYATFKAQLKAKDAADDLAVAAPR